MKPQTKYSPHDYYQLEDPFKAAEIILEQAQQHGQTYVPLHVVRRLFIKEGARLEEVLNEFTEQRGLKWRDAGLSICFTLPTLFDFAKDRSLGSETPGGREGGLNARS